MTTPIEFVRDASGASRDVADDGQELNLKLVRRQLASFGARAPLG